MNPVTAKLVDPKSGKRTEKEFLVGYETFTHTDGTSVEVEIWTHGGQLCRVDFTEDGTRHLVPLTRVGNPIRKNSDGTFRCYVEYSVPNPFGGPARVHREPTHGPTKGRPADHRAENIRQIPPGDPGYGIAGLRSDAESINRGHDDHLYLRRAHSVGAMRQLYDFIAYARTMNALALYRHRERQSEQLATAA